MRNNYESYCERLEKEVDNSNVKFETKKQTLERLDDMDGYFRRIGEQSHKVCHFEKKTSHLMRFDFILTKNI